MGLLDRDEETLREAFAIAREIGTPTPLVLAGSALGESIDEWLPRARSREAIEALRKLGRVDEAKAILDGWDVEDRALLSLRWDTPPAQS